MVCWVLLFWFLSFFFFFPITFAHTKEEGEEPGLLLGPSQPDTSHAPPRERFICGVQAVCSDDLVPAGPKLVVGHILGLEIPAPGSAGKPMFVLKVQAAGWKRDRGNDGSLTRAKHESWGGLEGAASSSTAGQLLPSTTGDVCPELCSWRHLSPLGASLLFSGPAHAGASPHPPRSGGEAIPSSRPPGAAAALEM